ncbi:MAG: hypothetical protein RMH77_07240 [Sulfolobales archaeon]|nr:hypothetical protein [Sulfolobales archaeon]MCX8186208.1 hypothetical protein [Sulfolobales archaeon]MDW7970173.1 hypothetical protein [Sulfolobales archaeon]
MSSDLDRFIRLIDSADFKSYSKLVLTSSREDLNCLASLLGSSNVMYLLINNVGKSATQDELWIRKLIEPPSNSLTRVKHYVISEVTEALILVELRSTYLLTSYEVLRELKRVGKGFKAVVILKVPPTLSEHDYMNLLTYISVLNHESLANFTLIISSKLLNQLKLFMGEHSLTQCLNNVLKFSSNIEKYLLKYRRVGVLTCFPKADIEIFGNLTNLVRFTHHLMDDYSEAIDSALLTITHSLKDLNSEVNYMKSRLKIRELELISVKSDGRELSIMIVEPNNGLLQQLGKFITKSYELIKDMGLNISLTDLTKAWVSNEVP